MLPDMPLDMRSASPVWSGLQRTCRAAAVIVCLVVPGVADAEVLVRWDRARVPAVDALGVRSLVVPAGTPSVAAAIEAGYRVYIETGSRGLGTLTVPAGVVGVIVPADASVTQVSALRRRLAAGTASTPPRTVRVLEQRGQWPHIRSNWVTSRDGVLQVASSTAQPWLANNLALVRAAKTAVPGETPLLAYAWEPRLPSGADVEPSLHDYLVAIGEAGSAGADLVLSIHERLQERLLLASPEARAWWARMRAAIDFYAWDVRGYRHTADVGVLVNGDPMRWFEVLNLLSRHNLPFEPVRLADVATRDMAAFRLLVVLDEPTPAQVDALHAFAKAGGIVVLPGLPGTRPWQSGEPASRAEGRTAWTIASASGNASVAPGQIVELAEPVVDPNTFALDMRALLGDERRTIQIWNGITVLAQHASTDDGATSVLTLLNYAEQPVEVQVRLPGTFSAIHVETPGEGAPSLLPFHQRGDHVEFVLPALGPGARVFLTR